MITSKKLFIIITFIFSALILTVFLMNPKKTTSVASYLFNEPAMIGNTSISLARISSPEDLQRGLSGQTELSEGIGLLFVFEQASSQPIWMKDMNFPIDVIWLDSDFSIVTIKKNFLPSSYPEIAFGALNSLYVLEVPAGFTEAHNINIGDKLKF